MALKPVSVTQLNSYIKQVLQSDPILGNVSVIGEISNLKFHGTGHIYFTLKDKDSKINCFLSKDIIKDIRFELSEGMEISAFGYIYLFERGGSYSLNIRDIEVKGLGNLSIAFEKLKSKLFSEGLFDEKHKKSLPIFPKKLVIITSETGAAVKDILKIIKNRNNIVDVLIYPVLVQGPAAAGEISSAIDEVNKLFPETDVMIVGRGGGSMEELWAFNEEIVARSIFASKIPIISAVGHEIDFTISDFVADRRAETPTAAAQIAVPDINELINYVGTIREKILISLEQILRTKTLRVQSLGTENLFSTLNNRISMNKLKIDGIIKDSVNSINNYISSNESKINNLKVTLDGLNPKEIMKRGYAAVITKEGRLANSVEQLHLDEELTVTMIDGAIDCTVRNIRRLFDGKK